MVYSLYRLGQAARAVALAGTGFSPINRHRLGAVLFDNKGRILSAKHNSRKTHPELQKRTQHPFQHAESATVLGYGLDNCEGHNLLVVRISALGTLVCSKPCSVCTTLMQDAKLRRVYYVNDNNEIEQLGVATRPTKNSVGLPWSALRFSLVH